jgi:hypothetical protein
VRWSFGLNVNEPSPSVDVEETDACPNLPETGGSVWRDWADYISKHPLDSTKCRSFDDSITFEKLSSPVNICPWCKSTLKEAFNGETVVIDDTFVKYGM